MKLHISLKVFAIQEVKLTCFQMANLYNACNVVLCPFIVFSFKMFILILQNDIVCIPASILTKKIRQRNVSKYLPDRLSFLLLTDFRNRNHYCRSARADGCWRIQPFYGKSNFGSSCGSHRSWCDCVHSRILGMLWSCQGEAFYSNCSKQT